MFGFSSGIILLSALVLIPAWLFQAYWGMRTFFEARDDVQQRSKVSAWLYTRFAMPVAIGFFLVFACLDMDFQGGDAKLTWSIQFAVAALMILLPSVLIIIGIRTYELCGGKH